MRKLPVVLLTLVVSVFASASEEKPSAFVLCKNQKTVRAIHITPDKPPEKTCKVTYSKTGVDEVVGQARTMDGCESILANVKKNLEASSWKCRNVGAATITTSSEVSVQ